VTKNAQKIQVAHLSLEGLAETQINHNVLQYAKVKNEFKSKNTVEFACTSSFHVQSVPPEQKHAKKTQHPLGLSTTASQPGLDCGGSQHNCSTAPPVLPRTTHAHCQPDCSTACSAQQFTVYDVTTRLAALPGTMALSWLPWKRTNRAMSNLVPNMEEQKETR
jgi:hypothetical protein